MTGPSVAEQIRVRCTQLQMPTAAAQAEPCFEAAGHAEALPTFLEVLDRESDDRHQRRVERLRRAAKLPPGKTPASFDPLRLPPKLPDIEITKPVFSTPTNVSVFETPCETFVKFSARSFRSYGTHVTKWVWDFNESDGYQEDFQSLDDPNVSHSFQRELVGTSICVTLRVFDNESTRRVELLANGVPYDDFGYEFNVTDGSLTVRLKVHVIAPPPPAPPTPAIKTDYGRFGLVAVILALVLASLVLLLRRGKGMAPGTKDNK